MLTVGNSEPRRLLGGPEIDVDRAERRVSVPSRLHALHLRYAKRVVARRERREGQHVTRNAWKEDE